MCQGISGNMSGKDIMMYDSYIHGPIRAGKRFPSNKMFLNMERYSGVILSYGTVILSKRYTYLVTSNLVWRSPRLTIPIQTHSTIARPKQ